MKKLIAYLILIVIIVLAFIYRDDITNYVTNNIVKQEKQEELKYNDYSKKKDYAYVAKRIKMRLEIYFILFLIAVKMSLIYFVILIIKHVQKM